jgi:hypothetical protein
VVSALRGTGVLAALPNASLFDLNVEKVLEHWTPAEGLREVIANALDEAALTGTADPVPYGTHTAETKPSHPAQWRLV